MKFVDDVPVPNRRRYDWAGEAAELRRNPGKWANLGVRNQGYVTMIRKGELAPFRATNEGHFEATTRREGGEPHPNLFARYVSD